MIEVAETCEACGTQVLIHFDAPGAARLSLVYWRCRRCDRPHASAFDWLHDESIVAELGRMRRKGKRWTPMDDDDD